MFMGGNDLTASTAQNYQTFAREASGRSPQYERLATEVADDAGILAFLAGLPRAKRQPNLLFAAARYLLGAPADVVSLRALISDRGSQLTAVLLAPRTPTNEPAPRAPLPPRPPLLPPPPPLLRVGAG